MVFDIPAGIDVAIDKQTHITVTGVDQPVGRGRQLRRLRKPDPYQQKGSYTGEVLKKAGRQGPRHLVSW